MMGLQVLQSQRTKAPKNQIWLLGGAALQRCGWRPFGDAALAAAILTSRSKIKMAALLASLLTLTACGYHTVASSAQLPQDVHTIAIPGFASHSQTFRVEQVLTDAVVSEFNARTQYHVIHNTHSDADATLQATVLSASASPLVYDSQTGRAISSLVTVNIQVTLTDRHGKVLFQNPSYLFHDQYEISSDLPSFFQEESPAIDRLSRDFARDLVANILEAY